MESERENLWGVQTLLDHGFGGEFTVCNLCGLQVSAVHLQEHNQIHEETGQEIYCDSCGIKFEDRDEFYEHWLDDCAEDANDTNTIIGEVPGTDTLMDTSKDVSYFLWFLLVFGRRTNF
jgi:hypothetical protein